MSFLRESADSERRSPRWDQRAGVSNYFALILGHVSSAVLALMALWLASRAIGASGYGSIVAVIAASQLLGQFALQWTAIAVFRHGCEEFVETGSIAASFWNRLVLLVLNLALVLGSAPLWLPSLSRWLELPAGAHWLLLAHLTVTAFAGHVRESLNAAKLPRFQSVVQFSEKVLLVSGVVALTLMDATSWLSIATMFTMTPAFAGLAGLFRLRRLIVPIARFDSSLMRRMLSFSFPLIFFSMVGYLTSSHVDAFFILQFLSPTALGVYALSYQLAGSFMQLPSLAGSLILAAFITKGSHGDTAHRAHFFSTTLPVLTLFWSLGCAFAAVAGSVIVMGVFDASFGPARELLWPLFVAAALAGPVTAGFGPLANARSRTMIPTLAAGAAALVNVVLNFSLIPRFGLIGCAWATTVSFAVSLVICACLVSRLETVPILPTLLMTAPALVGALFAHSSGDWMGLAAAVATAAAFAVLHRDFIRSAISETARVSFVRAEPSPEASE